MYVVCSRVEGGRGRRSHDQRRIEKYVCVCVSMSFSICMYVHMCVCVDVCSW